MKPLLKFSVLILVFIVFHQNCVAQQNTAMLSDQSKVTYTLNDSKKFEGVYSIEKGEGKVSLRGVYKNNVRSGNWYAFNENGNVFLRYNYDLKKLLFLDTVSTNRLQVNIKTNNPEVKEKATIPIPICSIDQYISILGTELRRVVLKDNKNAEGTLEADLITNIDKNGKATYEASYLADGILVTKRLIIAEKGFDIDWIPSSYNGQTYDSTFSVRAKIEFSQKSGISQRFIWVY